jgi:hypothetical protein
MLPARKYWARYLLHLTLGFLAGLVVGEAVQAATAVAGWAVVGATGGAAIGALAFMLRPDT